MKQEVPNGGSWERHPPQVRMLIGSRVDQRRHRQDGTRGNRMGRSEPSLLHHDDVRIGQGGEDSAQAPSSAGQVRPGAAGQGDLRNITRAPAPSTGTTGYEPTSCGWTAISAPNIGTRGSTSVSSASFASTPTFFSTGQQRKQQDDELPRVLWKTRG